MSRLIILYSFNNTSQGDWYHSVGQAVGDILSVTIPDLPHPNQGLMTEWLPVLEDLQPDQGTWLVGHSLGGTLILRYLEMAAVPVSGFILVATPINDLARNDLHATGFFDRDFDWPKIIALAPQRVVIGSTDDPTVPFWQAEYLSKHLQAELTTFQDKDHFHLKTFPELAAKLKALART